MKISNPKRTFHPIGGKTLCSIFYLNTNNFTMDPKEVNMTETESLQLITSMINKAKNRFTETGAIYILWGWMILVCCVVQFIALYFFDNQNAYNIWYATWLAPILQLVYAQRKKKSRTAKTYTEEIIGFVWVVFIICLALLVFIL